VKAGRGARMKPLGVLHLYRIRLRARLVQEAFAAVGIAVGVALLFATQVANTSLNGSVHQLTGGLVGHSQLQLSARDQNGFSESLLADVRGLPGVRSAAPILEAQANVIGPGGRRSVDFIGADPRFVKLGGTLLRHFSAAALARQHALALPAPIAQAIGATALEPVRLQIGESTGRALLGIVLQEAEIGSLAHSPVALAPLQYAQQLTGMAGRVTRIFVRSQPGRLASVETELRRLASNHLNVQPADFDATLFDSAAKPTNQSTEVFAAISALVGFLLAFDAILLTVPARRRFVADLRLDGYGPRTIIEVLLVDALVLGVFASVLGLLLGDELSLRLFHASPGYLSFAFPVGSQRIVTWQAVAVAVLGGVLAACLGVLGPMRQDILLTDAQGASRVGRRWPIGLRSMPLTGVGCLLVTTVVLVFAPAAAVVGIVTLTAALLLLLPSLIQAIAALTSRLTVDLRAKAPTIAVAELRSSWTRTVGIAATGAIAVFGSVAIQGAHADLQRGLDGSARDISQAADVWAFAPGMNNLLATASFRPTALPKLARLPGAETVSLYRGGFLDYEDRRVWVSGPPLSQRQLVPPHQIVEGNLALADRRVRSGGWAVISKAVAVEHGLHIGDAFTLPTPHPTRFRVAALGTNIGWPPGAIVINANDYARAWGSEDASAYEITTKPGTRSSTVAAEARSALGASSGLTVQTADERESRQRTASRQGLARLTQISVLVLIAAILAMAAAIGNMIWQRRPRLASLKLDGFSDLEVWRVLLLESVLLVGSGCFIGALFGLYGQVLGSHTILTVTGFPVVFSLRVGGALGSFALVTVVAVAITAVPGYLFARVQPAAGLAD
jgi:putative ABC transport system permease protein